MFVAKRENKRTLSYILGRFYKSFYDGGIIMNRKNDTLDQHKKGGQVSDQNNETRSSDTQNINQEHNTQGGFAAMDPEKQHEIARKGGKAPHEVRGFQAMDQEQQRDIARKGGHASHENDEARSSSDNVDKNESKNKEHHSSLRGFAAMDPEKQREIARKGGQASHGGHNKNSNTEENR